MGCFGQIGNCVLLSCTEDLSAQRNRADDVRISMLIDAQQRVRGHSSVLSVWSARSLGSIRMHVFSPLGEHVRVRIKRTGADEEETFLTRILKGGMEGS